MIMCGDVKRGYCLKVGFRALKFGFCHKKQEVTQPYVFAITDYRLEGRKAVAPAYSLQPSLGCGQYLALVFIMLLKIETIKADFLALCFMYHLRHSGEKNYGPPHAVRESRKWELTEIVEIACR
jgi:hypothetical protein